ncbi:uncharacterized protein [Apostichopus japonicus]|uniref:uncharacterized protein isoform X2 n=1 Tax=Stichopus japonicus TaxID=307972 RepID=UPI003AB2DF6E
MEVHIPMVAILIPLILSRWRSTEGVPLTSHRKPNDQLIEFSPEDSFNPTLDKFQKLFLELVIEDRKTDAQRLRTHDKKKEIFHQVSPAPHSTAEEIRQIIRKLQPNSHRSKFDDETVSSIQFEHEVIHSILHNTSHPLDDIIPNEVRQSVREMFSIPDEPFLSRSGRSKRGSQSESIVCQNRGDNVNGYLKLCKICHVITYFNDNYNPRSVSEVVCGNNNGESERTCLSGRGRCGERRIQITRYRQVHGRVSIQKKFIRVGCECELDPYSNIATLV